MDIRTPSTTDSLGVVFLSTTASPSYDDYYRTLNVLTPHLRENAWVDGVSGYYVSGICRLVRISYFTRGGGRFSEKSLGKK